jgi:nucleotide-binding universal stress UspA family protein
MSRKILVPIELTHYSINVLKFAQSVSEKGDELVLLHVVLDPSEFAGFHVPHVSMEMSREELMRDAREKMEKFVSHNAKGIPYLLEFGFPFKVILEVAEREKVDLIVIGSKEGAGRMEHIFVRGTSRKVQRDAPCEVKVVLLPLMSEEELQDSPEY